MAVVAEEKERIRKFLLTGLVEQSRAHRSVMEGSVFVLIPPPTLHHHHRLELGGGGAVTWRDWKDNW